MTGITVGFDGSQGAQRALEWAMSEAALRRAKLTVLAVHPVTISDWTGKPVTVGSDRMAVEQARQSATRAVAKAAAEIGEPGAPVVSVRAVNGSPAEELVATSKDADLLVLGSRGIGPVQRWLLGSVGSAVLLHAQCPVVVVPHDQWERRVTSAGVVPETAV